jgi:hypothetical protein
MTDEETKRMADLTRKLADTAIDYKQRWEDIDAAFTNLHREYDRRGDRIEELEAENRLLKDAVYIDDLTVTGMADDKAVLKARIVELKAKLGKAMGALDEAVYLLAPTEKDMERQAGVYRIVTTLAELKGQDDD